MESVAQACLALYCQAIPGASRVVASLRSEPDSPLATLAVWPAATPTGKRELAIIEQLAGVALAQGRTVTRSRRDAGEEPLQYSHAAVPFATGDGRHGCVTAELAEGARSTPGMVDLLHGVAGCLAAAIAEDGKRRRLGAALEVASLALELDDFATAATRSATELSTRLGCERVSIGFRNGSHVRVEAISHSARFDARTQLARALAEAMDEALDQDAVVAFPAHQEGGSGQITRVHRELVETHAAGSVCTVPVASGGRAVGAICFEWPAGRAGDADSRELCRELTALLGPVLHMKREREAGLLSQLRTRTRAALSRLQQPERGGLRLVVAAVAVCVLGVGVVRVEHRVTASARLEGRVQRAIVAGLEGYIAETHVRAGDVVRSGQLLALLDQRDLLLERQRLSAQRAQLRREYREALAGHDRTQLSILGARVAQAEAELRLVEENLQRTQLVAPFDGVVVDGDLSQSLGSPVSRGEVLFQIAPLDGYRIILEVDERDIAAVQAGVRGRLALTALPRRTLPLTVERVTPVSSAGDGRNYFRVEAHLDEPSGALRPGMHGVGKLRVGRRSLVWIWTHGMLDWLRLRLWSFWP